MTCASFCLLGCGSLCLLMAICLPMLLPAVYESILSKKLSLRNGTKTLETFRSPPVPIFMRFWFFNVTNPHEILQGKAPVLQEIGPFVYEEKRQKHSFIWKDEEGTIAFKQNTTYIFSPSLSNGLTEDVKITTINPVMLSVLAKVKEPGSLVKSVIGIQLLRFNMRLFITHTVGEFLFHGYEEPFLTELSKLTGKEAHKSGKFGFFFGKNNTEGVWFEVDTGVRNSSMFQTIVKWQGMPKLGYWKTELCNMINGSDGMQYPRPVDSKQMYFFSADLCRSLYVQYERDLVYGSLLLKRYVLPGDLLTKGPKTECYCYNDFTCRSSMMDVSPCREGSPVVISTPHFYQGDPVDIAMVQGLNPKKSIHETFMDVEPLTGVSFRAAKRIQINMPLKPYMELPELLHVLKMIFPIFWLSESVAVPEERTVQLYLLMLPLQQMYTIVWLFIALGGVLCFLAVLARAKCSRRSEMKVELGDKKPR